MFGIQDCSLHPVMCDADCTKRIWAFPLPHRGPPWSRSTFCARRCAAHRSAGGGCSHRNTPINSLVGSTLCEKVVRLGRSFEICSTFWSNLQLPQMICAVSLLHSFACLPPTSLFLVQAVEEFGWTRCQDLWRPPIFKPVHRLWFAPLFRNGGLSWFVYVSLVKAPEACCTHKSSFEKYFQNKKVGNKQTLENTGTSAKTS